MLVLSRKIGEKIMIGTGIEVQVVRINGDRVQLGFNAPKEIPIHRTECLGRYPNQQRLPEPTAPAPQEG